MLSKRAPAVGLFGVKRPLGYLGVRLVPTLTKHHGRNLRSKMNLRRESWSPISLSSGVWTADGASSGYANPRAPFRPTMEGRLTALGHVEQGSSLPGIGSIDRPTASSLAASMGDRVRNSGGPRYGHRFPKDFWLSSTVLLTRTTPISKVSRFCINHGFFLSDLEGFTADDKVPLQTSRASGPSPHAPLVVECGGCALLSMRQELDRKPHE